jgi:hypothetical protein
LQATGKQPIFYTADLKRELQQKFFLTDKDRQQNYFSNLSFIGIYVNIPENANTYLHSASQNRLIFEP